MTSERDRIATSGRDRIVLSGIEVWAHHGVLVHERERGQRFLIDAAVEMNLSEAMASDDIADTIDYGMLAQRIHAVAGDGPHDLLETVAGRILDVCLEDERVRAAEVVVVKPDAPLGVPAAEVRVEVRRRRP